MVLSTDVGEFSETDYAVRRVRKLRAMWTMQIQNEVLFWQAGLHNAYISRCSPLLKAQDTKTRVYRRNYVTGSKWIYFCRYRKFSRHDACELDKATAI